MNQHTVERAERNIAADSEIAEGLDELLKNVADNNYEQVVLEGMLQYVRSMRLGHRHRPQTQLEQVQAAFARGADKLLRYAITDKIEENDINYYTKSKHGRKPPATCDQLAMGIL